MPKKSNLIIIMKNNQSIDTEFQLERIRMGIFNILYRISRIVPGGGSMLRIIYSCDIPRHAKIAKSVSFQHRALGVVIHPDAEIGENQHHVTICVNKGTKGVPKLGANVFIGPYAMILGDIKIGDNATIGAGTLVMKDIEAGATYTGNTKMIRRR